MDFRSCLDRLVIQCEERKIMHKIAVNGEMCEEIFPSPIITSKNNTLKTSLPDGVGFDKNRGYNFSMRSNCDGDVSSVKILIFFCTNISVSAF